MNELPPPTTPIEAYLAYIAGMSVEIPNEPSNRVEWFLSKWAEIAR